MHLRLQKKRQRLATKHLILIQFIISFLQIQNFSMLVSRPKIIHKDSFFSYLMFESALIFSIKSLIFLDLYETVMF